MPSWNYTDGPFHYQRRLLRVHAITVKRTVSRSHFGFADLRNCTTAVSSSTDFMYGSTSPLNISWYRITRTDYETIGNSINIMIPRLNYVFCLKLNIVFLWLYFIKQDCTLHILYFYSLLKNVNLHICAKRELILDQSVISV